MVVAATSIVKATKIRRKTEETRENIVNKTWVRPQNWGRLELPDASYIRFLDLGEKFNFMPCYPIRRQETRKRCGIVNDSLHRVGKKFGNDIHVDTRQPWEYGDFDLDDKKDI